MKVLVAGGAGYVGGSACAWLLDHGHDVWVLDDLSTGYRELALGSHFIHARVGDRAVVSELLKNEHFDCVMHFAAKSLVAESVLKPAECRENNVEQTRALLETMLETGTHRFIFSSTCAIFDDPGTGNIREHTPKNPISPYGATKLEAEKMIEEFSKRGLQAVALRYFNAAGAEAKQRVGEQHEPESHLIPNVLKAALNESIVDVFGTDYPTPDGTCIRDYIHVWDLAQAHAAAMVRLSKQGEQGSFEVFNLGSETGYSVKQVIQTCEKIIGKRIRIDEKPRRPGDRPRLVADSALAKKELGFFSQGGKGLEEIISSAWEWEKMRRTRKFRAIFIDRDGTLNEDPGYLAAPEQLKLYPNVGQALATLKEKGFRLVVVSNQSGVGRGLILSDAIPKINDRFRELLKPYSVSIDRIELCFHRPDENCDCRKPKPKLILNAAEALRVDLSQSFMVGDKISDLEAGRAAGCKTALVRTGDGAKSESGAKGLADFIGDSVLDVARWIAGD